LPDFPINDEGNLKAHVFPASCGRRGASPLLLILVFDINEACLLQRLAHLVEVEAVYDGGELQALGAFILRQVEMRRRQLKAAAFRYSNEGKGLPLYMKYFINR
jgi:hypothetical protein